MGSWPRRPPSGGVYREYGFTGDLCFVSGVTSISFSGTYDLGDDLCEVGGAGAVPDFYVDGVALDVTEIDDGFGNCTYLVNN